MQIEIAKIWYQILIVAVVSYSIGMINFALIISRFKKTDVRTMGSGNPGTLNMSRNFGLKIGLFTLFLDMVKGGLPSLIAFLIFKNKYVGNFELSDFMRYVSGFMVVVGHIFPFTLNFKGGKGVASTLGVFVFSHPLIALVVFFITLLYMYYTEWGSMASLLAVSGMSIIEMVYFYYKYNALGMVSLLTITYLIILLLCFLIWFAHRKNIIRLLAGEERHTSLKSLSKKK